MTPQQRSASYNKKRREMVNMGKQPKYDRKVKMKKPRINRWNYFEDKVKIAMSFGYNHPDEMISDMTEKGYSTIDIGKKLDVNQFCILQHQKDLGIKTKLKGGANYTVLMPETIKEIQALPKMNKKISCELGAMYLCHHRTVWTWWNKANNGGHNERY